MADANNQPDRIVTHGLLLYTFNAQTNRYELSGAIDCAVDSIDADQAADLFFDTGAIPDGCKVQATHD